MTLRTLAKTLSRMRPGHRHWFWLCTDVPRGVLPLLLQPVQKDPSQEALLARVAEVEVAPGMRIAMGLVTADRDGVLTFVADGLSHAQLRQLASWVQHSAPALAPLARLRDAVFVDADVQTGEVRARHADPTLWDALSDKALPGSLAKLDQRLQQLRPRQRLWFWMTSRGPGGEPTILLRPKEGDADGAAFVARVMEVRRQSGAAGVEIRGSLVRASEDDDALLMTTSDSVAHGGALLAMLMYRHQPLLGALSRGRLIERDGESIARVVRPASAPLAPDQGTVEAIGQLIEQEEPMVFWLTEADRAGRPRLLIAAKQGSLKALASEHAGPGEVARGKISMRPGVFLFKTRGPAMGSFMPILSRWVEDNLDRIPGLPRMRTARLVCVDESGETIDRREAVLAGAV